MAENKTDEKLYNEVAEAILKAYKAYKRDPSSTAFVGGGVDLFIKKLKVEMVDNRQLMNEQQFYTNFQGDAAQKENDRGGVSAMFRALNTADKKTDRLELLDKLIDCICKLFGISTPSMNKEARAQGESFAVNHLKEQLFQPPNIEKG